MDLQVQLCAHLHAAPGALVGWLHTLAETYAVELSWPETLMVGPHTFTADAPTAYETLALYVVDSQKPHNIVERKVALALTYLPLRQPRIGLDLRVWPLFPATLETLIDCFLTHFTQASPVFSSVADLHFNAGAPQLACNRWLIEQFANPTFASDDAAAHLYTAWLEQYRALKGAYPADPRRAFRAVRAAYRRNHKQEK
jgi:hypothetical protein